tara:strand:+ start:267 stop:863 length:597 start_codon:yes stop_codon:yes gene_type:complete
MKPLLSILLICSIGLTQELTVDGNLNVTGNIQNQTIDSLQQVIAGLQAQIAAMQGNGRLETRVFELDRIDFYGNLDLEINLQEITGFDLEYASIGIARIIDYWAEGGSHFQIKTQSQSNGDIYWNGGPGVYLGGNQGGEPNYQWGGTSTLVWGGTSPIRIEFLGAYGWVDLALAITADFANAPIYQAPAPPQNSRTAP